MVAPTPTPEVIVLTRRYDLAHAAGLVDLGERCLRDHVERGHLAAAPDGTIDGLELFRFFRALRKGRYS